MIDLQHHFTGTYAKNLLVNWAVMADLIKQKTTWMKDTLQNQSQSLILTNQQMDDVFNGPFQQFFKLHLRGYAQISKIETALTIEKDELFKESEFSVDATLDVPRNLLNTMEYATLKELHNKLNVLTKENYAQWELHTQTWANALIQALKENNITLSDIELHNFTINQPISELQDLFINLKLTIPKLSKSAFDFQQYFILKTTLMVQSALGRAQQSHTDKEIEQFLKILKPIFKTIDETTKTTSAAQEKAVNELLIPIMPPLLNN